MDEAIRPGDTIGTFAELIAAGTPTPGGGSVAAYCGLLATSLGRMMCNLTLGKKKYADVREQVEAINTRLERFGENFRLLIDEDAASFEDVLAAYRLPQGSEEERITRELKIEEATRYSISVPLEIAHRAIDTLELLAELAAIGNPNALPDLTIGSQLASVAVKGAYYNVRINIKSVTDEEFCEATVGEMDKLLHRIGEATRKIEARLAG